MASEFMIYHNPRCRKSREALGFLRENDIEPEIREYLKETPSQEEIKKVLAKLNMPVENIIRKEERDFKEQYKGMNFNEDEWVKILSENPKLIQRPIVIKNNKAVIGRPLDNVKDLL